MLGTQTPWLGRSSQSVYIFKFGNSVSKKENLAQEHPSDLTQNVLIRYRKDKEETAVVSLQAVFPYCLMGFETLYLETHEKVKSNL